MSLGIEQVIITDALTERAKTCTTILAPLERIGAPIGEFQFPGDTQGLSGTNIRPNGATLNVFAGYGNVPLHNIFSGTVEEMDDLEDADLYNYTIVLSAIPPSQNHRTKLTLLYDFPFNIVLATPITTTHTILKDACSAAGIPFGRCDLPSVQVWGSYEIIRRNICEIAEGLCQPFNAFDYKHYYVRVSERDGLSIIAIDYTKGGEVSNLYEVENVEQKTRTFQRYMPDNRIGDSDVLLIGADMYNNDPDSNSGTITDWQRVTHTYHSDSREDNKDAGTESWVETETTIEFLLEVVNNPGQSWGSYQKELDFYLEALAAGAIANLIIAESNVLHIITNTFDNEGTVLIGNKPDPDNPSGPLIPTYGSATQRTQRNETWYTYNTIKFPLHVYKAGERTANVLVYEETLTSLYPDGNDFDQTLVKRWYGYSDSGVQNTTTTKTYYNDGRDAWVLQNISSEYSDSPSLTNALIQFYVDKANKGPDFVYNYSYMASLKWPKAAVVIGKYKLLNGYPLNVNTVPPRTITNADSIGYDPTAAEFEQEQREKRCFQMSIPYMGWDGLDLIWAMCVRQKELEKAGVYWESVKATATIDTSPAAGESVIVSGSSGICDSIEHTITSDAAMTTLSTRRLITPTS